MGKKGKGRKGNNPNKVSNETNNNRKADNGNKSKKLFKTKNRVQPVYVERKPEPKNSEAPIVELPAPPVPEETKAMSPMERLRMLKMRLKEQPPKPVEEEKVGVEVAQLVDMPKQKQNNFFANLNSFLKKEPLVPTQKVEEKIESGGEEEENEASERENQDEDIDEEEVVTQPKNQEIEPVIEDEQAEEEEKEDEVVEEPNNSEESIDEINQLGEQPAVEEIADRSYIEVSNVIADNESAENESDHNLHASSQSLEDNKQHDESVKSSSEHQDIEQEEVPPMLIEQSTNQMEVENLDNNNEAEEPVQENEDLEKEIDIDTHTEVHKHKSVDQEHMIEDQDIKIDEGGALETENLPENTEFMEEVVEEIKSKSEDDSEKQSSIEINVNEEAASNQEQFHPVNETDQQVEDHSLEKDSNIDKSGESVQNEVEIAENQNIEENEGDFQNLQYDGTSEIKDVDGIQHENKSNKNDEVEHSAPNLVDEDSQMINVSNTSGSKMDVEEIDSGAKNLNFQTEVVNETYREEEPVTEEKNDEALQVDTSHQDKNNPVLTGSRETLTEPADITETQPIIEENGENGIIESESIAPDNQAKVNLEEPAELTKRPLEKFNESTTVVEPHILTLEDPYASKEMKLALVTTALEFYKELEAVRNILPLSMRRRIFKRLKEEGLIGSIVK